MVTTPNLKSTVDWDAVRLFLAVARAEGLSGAARQTGQSPATLGRRMTALEEALGQRLFVRERMGYRLTREGQQLLLQAQEMETAAIGIERWREDLAPRRVVRVSAGSWMSWFFARHIERLWTPDEPWAIDFVTANARLDIARRQADVGIRNRAPEEPWLAGRRVHQTAFAVYAREDAASDPAAPWIGVTGEGAVTPSARWAAEQHAVETALRGNDPRLVRDLLRAGAGRAVLPCFVGDADPALVRIGGPIDELTHHQWVVMHNEDRRTAPIRTAIDRVVALLEEHRGLFAGERPRDTRRGRQQS